MTRRAWRILIVGGMWPVMAAAGDVQVQVTERGKNVYQVRGTLIVPASVSTVWDVLTDYERIDEFESSMVMSRVRERLAAGALVEQEARNQGTLFAPRLSLLLEVTEQPFRRIAFREISRRDFSAYDGAWTLAAADGIVTVQYSLDATPRTIFPNLVARYALRRTAQSLLREVAAEILRVQAGSRKHGAP